MIRIILLLLLSALISSCNRPHIDYDVIIIGGGLSGLSASTALDKSLSSLIIEKDSVLGGRVLTNNYKNKYFYDLGAVYILDSSYFDELPIDDTIIEEKGDIGIWDNDSIYLGDSFKSAIKSYCPNQRILIDSIFRTEKFDFSQLNGNILEAFNTNIKSVFPGSIFNYNLFIQQYAKVRYNSSHFLKGNQSVKNKLMRSINSTISLNTLATKVDDINDFVQVSMVENGISKTLRAKKVIVATNALVANTIIKKKSELFKQFIEPLNYAPYISIAIGIKDSLIKGKEAYIIPINKGFSAILKQKTIDYEVTIFQLYVANDDILYFSDMESIKANAYKILKDIWKVDSSKTIFYDHKYWASAGVLANNHYEKSWNHYNFKASKNVYISGDYCSLKGVPYGMIPAMQTGLNSAKQVNEEIK